jgi:hypothetical protein
VGARALMQVYYQDRLVGEFRYSMAAMRALNDSYICVQRIENIFLNLEDGPFGPFNSLPPAPTIEKIVFPVKTRRIRITEHEIQAVKAYSHFGLTKPSDFVEDHFRRMGADIIPEYEIIHDINRGDYIAAWKAIDLGGDLDLYETMFELNEFQPV